MSQQTLGILSIQAKNQFLREIYKYQVVTERQFDLSVEAAQQVLKLDIKEQQSVYGFILEGSNAIEDWYSVVTRTSATRSKRFIIHGSSNPDNARRETNWFQNLLLNDSSSSSLPESKKKVTSSSVAKSGTQQSRKTGLVRSTPSPTTMTTAKTTKTSRASTTTIPATRSKIPSVKSNTAAKSNMTTTTRTNQKSVTPINKRSSEATNTTMGTTRRGSLVTSSIPASSKKLLSTTSRGGISKNTPPVSIITGRTRKPSRLMEKRPVTTTTTKNKVQPIAIKEVEIKEEKDIKQDEAIVIKSDPVKEQEKDIKQDEAVVIKSDPVTEEEIAPVVVEEKVDAIVPEQEEKVDSIVPEQEPVVTEQDISLVTEEPEKQKDDEFINVSPPPVSHPSTCSSAATDEHDAEVAAATQKRPVADSFTFTNSGRSSFSPNSVASLPRPQTPEVDQLRLKFETIIQTTTPVEPQMMRRPSSKMSSEFISRIKEMKPRGPAGARVKSMVELFMDENLNKWEF